MASKHRYIWHPEDSEMSWFARDQESTHRRTDKLTVGDIVVYERYPYTITRIDPDALPYQHWPQPFQESWRNENTGTKSTDRPEQWERRPWRIDLEIIGGARTPRNKRDNGRFAAVAASPTTFWTVLAEHFSVCRICQELPPCRHAFREKLLKRQEAHLNKALNLMPGTCLACAEPISKRQKTIIFNGPNLIRPDFGNDSAIFHARRSCRSRVEDYDHKLTKATGVPGRFHCPGNLTIHTDKSTDCTQPETCPGREARHPGYEYHQHTQQHQTYGGCWCLLLPPNGKEPT